MDRDEDAPSGDRFGGLDTRRLACLLGLVLLAVLAGCDERPPRQACGICERGPETVPGDLTVESSELEIRTFRNGSSRWTARLDVNGSAPNGSARDALETAIRRGFEDRSGHPTAAHGGDVRNVSVTAENGTLVATYRVSGVATARPDGYVVLTRFHGSHRPDETHPKPHEMGADEVRVYAPPGMAVANGPGPATVGPDGRSLAWESAYWDHDATVPVDTYVVFGPDRTRTTRLGARAVVAHETLAWGGPVALQAAAVVAASIAVPLGVIGDVTTGGDLRRWLRRPGLGRRRLWTAVGGVLLVALATAAHLAVGPVGRPRLPVYGGAFLLAGLTAGALGSLTARDHWATAPVAAFLLALPAYPASMVVFEVGFEFAVTVVWGVPTALFCAGTFVLGYFRGE